MANNYTIPFGINSRPFFEELNKMEGGVGTLTSNVVASNADMQKAWTASAQGGEKFNKVITDSVKNSTALANQAKTLGDELGKGLGGKQIGGELEKKLANFTLLLDKFKRKSSEPVKFNINAGKLEEFEKLLINGAKDLEVLGAAVTFAKSKLDAMDPNSAEFAQLSTQIDTASGFLKEMADTASIAEVKNKSLKVQLRELKAAMADMELAGREDTQEFQNMAIAAGKLEDQIGDISARVRVLASDTKHIDAGIQAVTGLVGAFTAAQGAITLFGEENEDVAKAIQKVTGAMAILQGIQAVANALNKDSALSVLLFSRATKTATIATAAQTTATAAGTAATVTGAAAFKAFTLALITNPIFLVIAAITAIVAALVAFGDASEDAEERFERLNDEIERSKFNLDILQNDIKRATDISVARAKLAGKTEEEIAEIERKALNRRAIEQLNFSQKLVAQYNREAKEKKLNDEQLQKLRDDAVKAEQDSKDLLAENQIKALDNQTAINKKRVEDGKKAAEEYKKILEQQIKFTRELEAARIEAIGDEYAKERLQVHQRFKEKIEDLNREKALSEKASKERTALIAQLQRNEAEEIKKINLKEQAARTQLEFEAQRIVSDLLADGAQKEIEVIRLNFIEKRRQVEEQFKNDAVTRKKLIALLNQAEADEQEKGSKARVLAQIAQEEEREVLLLETAAKFIGGGAKVEEQKQIAILEVKIKFAQKQLEALLAQGNAETSIVVLQAKKTIQELNKALDTAVTQSGGKGFDLFEFLGLGDLTEEQRQAVTQAVQSSLDSIRSITDGIIDQYQRQIDKRQEVIDQIEESIDNLEDQLEREQELREQGFANNVDLIQQELEAKRQQREQEIKQQEELQRKQRAAQRAQLAIDTITQASNLITSASQIFKALSGIPFIGIPLAIATIALMSGAFIAAKVKAFQLVGQGSNQSFGGGGYIDGKPHSQGGKKYVSADGTGNVVELEEGEHVTNRKSTEKYGSLLDAINADRLDKMTEGSLRDMLAGMGINFDAKTGEDAVMGARARDDARDKVFVMQGESDNPDLTSINDNVKYLAEKKRNDITRWADDKYYYEHKGNTTLRIPKK